MYVYNVDLTCARTKEQSHVAKPHTHKRTVSVLHVAKPHTHNKLIIVTLIKSLIFPFEAMVGAPFFLRDKISGDANTQRTPT
jgi:hypothetical protein